MVNIYCVVTHCEVYVYIARRADGAYALNLGYVLIYRHKTGYAALNLGFVNNVRFRKTCLNRLGYRDVVHHYGNGTGGCLVCRNVGNTRKRIENGRSRYLRFNLGRSGTLGILFFLFITANGCQH